jgi:hypothetical protein
MHARTTGRDLGDDGERGAALVMLAIVLVVLMIFAALSVDIGAAYAQRRQNQSAADVGASAGGVEFLLSGNFDKVVSTARTVAGKNLPAAPTDAQWAACTDPGALPIASSSLSPTYGTPCISFKQIGTRGMMEMRVRVPQVSTATAFAGVIGWHTITSSASSVVKMGSPLGGALPVYVLSGVNAGEAICVLSGPPGQNLGCNDPVSGTFGGYAPYYYNAVGCPDGNQGSGNYYSIAPAIAQGLDHFLAPYTDYPSPLNTFVSPLDTLLTHQRINGGGACTVIAPNTVQTTTGFSNQSIAQGVISGNNNGGPAYDGRLAGGPFSGGGPGGVLNPAVFKNSNYSNNDVTINNAPLWYFLRSQVKNNNSYPLECQAAAELSPKRDVALTQLGQIQVNHGLIVSGKWAYATPEALMSGCLSKWVVADGQLFSEAIGETMRLGSVPRFWETSILSQDHIRDFVPVYLNGEFQKGSKLADPGTDTNYSHWAGDPVSKPSAWTNVQLAGEGGVFVPCLSLPSTVCTSVYHDPSDNGLGGVLGGVTTIQ